MILNDMKNVWAPDGREGFLLGTVKDINTEMISVEVTKNKSRVITAPYNRVFPAEDDLRKDYDDNCALMYLNEATLLHNVRIRYENDKIYTYVANILIAVNPYADISHLYSKDTIMKYKGKSIGQLPPHVFAIADKAYRDMKVFKQSQSIIVSGESGAGKTESTKYVIRYLTESYGQGISGNIEKKIVETNPLLEAFGNAKTLRNLNSSRFGKYVEVHFGDKAEINGAFVSHYLLEKTRICTQTPGERNYHVFYRMCAAAPNEMRSALKLNEASYFNYLNKGSLKEPGINDVEDFKLLNAAMDSIGITMQQKSDIYRILAAVLHMGNIEFQENMRDKKGGCQVTPESEKIAADVAKFLGVQGGELIMCLTTRIMTTTKGGAMGTMYKVPLSPDQAAAGRDAFAKSIYSKLFDHIVACVNLCFPFKDSQHYIGVLDIAGFEFFEANGFEQFCINYCNEKLQQFFNERILKEEQALYKKEGLGLKDIAYTDNQDCIELFEQKRTGIMDLLDEEMKFPAPSEMHFTVEVHQKNKDHFRLAVPRKSPLPIHRTVKDDEGFLIRHFAGAVCYQTAGFLSRNNDALHENLELLLQESTDNFIKNLFPQAPPPQYSGPKKGGNSKKLAFESIGKKFRSQLSLLMEKLRNTGSNFIRCIKPNDQFRKHDFEGGQILSQLQCAGMVSVLHLMQEGFPSRTAFSDLYHKYKSFLPASLVKLDPRTFSHALFHAVGMDSNDFKFGLTKVFFRAGKFAEFDQIMHSDPATLNELIKKVMRWIIRNRWKRAIWCSLSVQKLANKIAWRREMYIRIQKTVRMYLAVRKHRHRYKGLMRISTVETQIDALVKLVGSLKKDNGNYKGKVKDLSEHLDKAKKQIKLTIMNVKQIDGIYNDLIQKVNSLLNAMHSVKAAQQEQERLAKIEEQMKLEKQKQEEEERKKIEAEKQRKERLAHEAKLKKEAEEAEKKRKIEDEKARASVAKMEEERAQNDLLMSQQEAQKQRDYELALRLAADPATMVSEDRIQLKRNIPADAGGEGKFDHLRKWTYAELRDTINTSCDLELLEACRIEFHRRLKVYHAWRKRHMKNKNKGNQRAPVEIIKHGEAIAPTWVSLTNPFRADPVNEQRFFRVPFSKPSDQYRFEEYRKSGWWYAHFDGEWVARQVELHPNGALLLVAGHNDTEICELSLAETRLRERPGAEISANDFNEMWQKYGGDVNKIFKGKAKR